MLGYLIFRSIGIIFIIIPFRVLYVFSDFLAFISTYLIGYRKKVIEVNLSIAFPDLSPKEKRSLIYKTYQNLFDIFVESFKSYSVKPEKLEKRFKVVNTELLDSLFEEGTNVITFASHTNNWEWGPVILPLAFQHYVIGLIKPLKNKRIYNYVTKARGVTGCGLHSIYDSHDTLNADYDRPKMIIYIADQNPSNKEKAIPVKFFNTETLCLHGGEKMARRTNYPVFNLLNRRVKRGYYEIEPVLITMDPSQLSPNELTQKYMTQLEKSLEGQPSSWLWTHKRWKHSHSYK